MAVGSNKTPLINLVNNFFANNMDYLKLILVAFSGNVILTLTLLFFEKCLIEKQSGQKIFPHAKLKLLLIRKKKQNIEFKVQTLHPIQHKFL